MNNEVLNRLKIYLTNVKNNPTSNKTLILLALFLVVLPAVINAYFIKIFAVNVVYYDQWVFVPLIDKLYTGTLTIGDLFKQYNDHRLFFPYISMLILSYITKYNNIAEMFFSWALCVITGAIIFHIYKINFKNLTIALLGFIPVMWMLFNLRQLENILFGWQISIYLCVFGFIVSIFILNKINKIELKMVWAIIFGIISSFSFINGLLVWPVGLLLILLSNIKKKVTIIVIWIITSLIVYIIYFYNWVHPAYNPPISYSFYHIDIMVKYFITNLGSPISFNVRLDFVMGVLLLVCIVLATIVTYKNKLIAENAIWFSMIAFSLLSAFLCAFGRSGFDIEHAIYSRYTTFIIIGIIGLYVLLFTQIIKIKRNKTIIALFTITLVLMSVSIYIGYTEGFSNGKIIHEQRTYFANILYNYKNMSDDKVNYLCPNNVAMVRNESDILVKYKLNVFDT